MPRARTICSVAGCPATAHDRGRCRDHATIHYRRLKATTPTAIDAQRTRAIRKRAVDNWRAVFGDWCPGYKRPGHYSTDLTAQHAHALAAGGDPNQPLKVLCRACNSHHGADVQAALARRYAPTPGEGA